MAESIVKFLRQKDLVLKRDLGQGASGRTVLLFDDVINEYFVCKKYEPYDEAVRVELFKNFVREVKLLHMLNHPNVVRVFNYYLYPGHLTGYILMEYIKGTDIEEHLQDSPEDVNEMFKQAVEGFNHLEKHGILHRDLRPQNILVGDNGLLKIIDLGFGKHTESSAHFDKSVSLNWWCAPPNDFADDIYNHATDVYFLGMLFAEIIAENGIDQFRYHELMSRMCKKRPTARIQSFAEVRTAMLAEGFESPEFSDHDIAAYRAFSDALDGILIKVEHNAKYNQDVDDIVRKLDEVYKSTMLEKNIPHNPMVIRCFLPGSYYYRHNPFPVSVLKNFLILFRACSQSRQNIILANLNAKLDAVTRDDPEPLMDDDEVPF